MDLSFDDLHLRARNGRILLGGVSGRFRQGELGVVLGPSGAGKTTLLQVLAGRLRQDGGVVRLNGQAASPSHFGSLMGFVPEEDIMLPALTVEETLRFAARLRLPRELQPAARNEEVEHTLRLLGLASIRASRVGDATTGSISFGERRRLNIGIELVGRPSVVMVDDATAGLDSETALQVLSCLRLVSRRGINVVTILHQPSHDLFQMFSSLLLMTPHGRVAFQGRTAVALGYFADVLGLRCPRYTNPAEFLLELVSEPPPLSSSEAEKQAQLHEQLHAEAATVLVRMGDEAQQERSRQGGPSDEAGENVALLADHDAGAAGRGGGAAHGSPRDCEFRRRVARFLHPSGAAKSTASHLSAFGFSDDDEGLLGRAACTEPSYLAQVWAQQAGASMKPALVDADSMSPLPLPRRSPPSFLRLLLLFGGRAFLQARRANNVAALLGTCGPLAALTAAQPRSGGGHGSSRCWRCCWSARPLRSSR